MSKRKAEAPAGRSGKAKAAPDEDEQDLVGSAKDDGEDEDDGLDAALGGDDDEDDLADVLGGDDDEDDLGGDDGVPPFDATEIGELPDGLEQSQLTDEEDVDLSKIELTVPQARRVAQLLAQNGSLSKIKLPAHSISISDLEEDELEWDSEEYNDVEAIIIAELLKTNETVKRLDLARNCLSDAGVAAIAQMLCVNKTIEYVNLESNEFGERGGVAFIAAVAANSTLSYLNLKENSLPATVKSKISANWQLCEDRANGVGLHF